MHACMRERSLAHAAAEGRSEGEGVYAAAAAALERRGVLAGGVSRTASSDPRATVGTRWPCLVRYVLGRGGQARGEQAQVPTQYPPRGAKSYKD